MLSLFLQSFLGIFVCAFFYIMSYVKETLLWIKRLVHHETLSTEPEKLKCVVQ